VVAVVGWFAATAGGLAGLAVHALNPVPIVANTFGLGPSGMVAFVVLGISWATVGALLMVRRPENVVGRYMVIVGAGYSLSILAAAVTFGAVASHDAGLARAAAWWTVLLSSIGELVLYLAFIFPTGRGHTPRWDLVGRIFLVAMLFVLAWLLVQPGPMHLFPTIDNPITGGPDLRPLLGTTPAATVFAFSVVTLPILLGAVVSRYRAADRVQRQQLKWAFAAISLCVAALLLTAVVAVAGRGRSSEAPLTMYAIAGALIPVAIGIAILRYHLFDIDRIISRSLSWALISGILGVTFAAAVIVLQAAMTGFTQGQTIAVATSTLVAFALFQPVRRRVQAAIDRRFDRSRYDAERTASAFAGRVRSEADLETLEDDVTRTVHESLHPRSAAIWVRAHGRGQGA
jgi:hypothetical protein